MRKLLCTCGEVPLSEAEADQIIALADPRGTGRISVEAFKGLPCWVPPKVTPAQISARRRGTPAPDLTGRSVDLDPSSS